MLKTRLGIDIGVASLGWFLYSLRDARNEHGKPVTEISGVVDAGVRIFSSGRDPQSYTSLNEDRRNARGMRRRRDRYLQRRNALMRYLVRYGLMPEDRAARKRLEKLNPYELRAWAMTGDESTYPQFEPQHLVGRAIFHLNQRRGFKSNRITDKGKDDGPVNESVKQFRAQLGGKTVGQFLWETRKGESIRARREGTKKTDLYDCYADRSMIEKEFNDIWQKQAEIRPQIFGGKIGRERGRIVREIIFHQRDLKPPIVGNCLFYHDEKRAARALPSFQRFRILHEVNNLRFYDAHGKEQKLPPQSRADIISKLQRQKGVTFGAMKKILGDSSAVFNLESGGRDGLDGDKTSAIFRKIAADKWDGLSLEQRDECVSLLLGSASDYDTEKELVGKWQFSRAQVKECNAKIGQFPDGHAQLSARAIGEILPHLEEGFIYNEAVKKAGLGSHSDRRENTDEEFSCLPPYPEVLSEYCLPRRTQDENKPETWRISNPTVHIGLNQLRAVVNDIIRIYGKPTEIVVELARDLPRGKKRREEVNKQQTQNQKDNEDRAKKINELGLRVNSENLLRMRLWEELGDNPNDRCCIYTGNRISCEKLFSPEIEIEHILPFSKTLDNGFANKTLCFRQANRYKGEHAPCDAFAESNDYSYADILARAKRLSNKGKIWRFQAEAMQRFEREQGFLDRQLVETQYLASVTRRYLETICPNGIWVIPGRLTAALRRAWGLETILGEARKNRDDHRHHSIDAAVIGATTRSLLQKLATAAERAGEENIGKLFANDDELQSGLLQNFRDAVAEAINGIIVSHKPQRHRQGKLHNETAYGIPDKSEREKEGIRIRTVTHRVPLTKIQKAGGVKKIVSESIKSDLTGLLAADDFKKAVAEYARRNKISRVRVEKNLTVIPIADSAGNVYKAYKGDNNWAYEIYAAKGGKWGGEVITTFDANQQATDKNGKTYYSFVPRWQRRNPTPRLVMRVHAGDMLAFEEKGKTRIVRVQKISKGRITFTNHIEANVDKRTRDKSSDFRLEAKSPGVLQKCHARKIHISPAGRVYDPGPPSNEKTK